MGGHANGTRHAMRRARGGSEGAIRKASQAMPGPSAMGGRGIAQPGRAAWAQSSPTSASKSPAMGDATARGSPAPARHVISSFPACTRVLTAWSIPNIIMLKG
jgi:hypothetical protein